MIMFFYIKKTNWICIFQLALHLVRSRISTTPFPFLLLKLHHLLHQFNRKNVISYQVIIILIFILISLTSENKAFSSITIFIFHPPPGRCKT